MSHKSGLDFSFRRKLKTEGIPSGALTLEEKHDRDYSNKVDYNMIKEHYLSEDLI
jgi:hypothetical protein